MPSEVILIRDSYDGLCKQCIKYNQGTKEVLAIPQSKISSAKTIIDNKNSISSTLRMCLITIHQPTVEQAEN